jgi:hypothetical protein
VGTVRLSDPAVGPQALRGVDQFAGLSGRAVMMLGRPGRRLELQVEKYRDQLGEAGYLDLVDNDSDALFMTLADAEETRRAREVIAVQEHLFDDEDDVALMLEQATAVMADTTCCRRATSCPERCALIAETVQFRAELGEAGYPCWMQPPAEVVRELIADVERADALEKRYLRERRLSQQMADIARRALTRAHAVAHAGAIDACPHCASDWAQLPARVQIAF